MINTARQSRWLVILTAWPALSYVVRQYMAPHTDVKRGGAELMVLSAIERRTRHGYEIARLIDEQSGGVLRFHVASLYPMLYRMERRGWIDAEWGASESNRRAKFYRLTRKGRSQLKQQVAAWEAVVAAVGKVLDAAPAGGLR